MVYSLVVLDALAAARLDLLAVAVPGEEGRGLGLGLTAQCHAGPLGHPLGALHPLDAGWLG